VTMGEISSSRMSGPPELMELENAFARVLRSVDGFHVHGTRLELLRKGTVLATFRLQE
jgi:heat shock protein HslJ